MQNKRLNSPLRAVAVLAVVAVALLVSGCSLSQRGKIQKNVSQNDLAAGNEPYFDVGGLTVQIEESRQLNPYSGDVTYFTGLKGAQSIPGSDFWFGVFVWAKNQNKRTITTPSYNDFVLTDSAGNSYLPIPLNSNINPWAWTSTQLGQNDIEPSTDSIAGSGTTAGGLVLFELPQAAYQNRPLTLHVYPYGERHSQKKHVASAISLDL